MRSAYRNISGRNRCSGDMPTHLGIVGVLGGFMEGRGGQLVLLPRGRDAVPIGGRRSVADMLVGLGEVCGLHGASVAAQPSWQVRIARIVLVRVGAWRAGGELAKRQAGIRPHDADHTARDRTASSTRLPARPSPQLNPPAAVAFHRRWLSWHCTPHPPQPPHAKSEPITPHPRARDLAARRNHIEHTSSPRGAESSHIAIAMAAFERARSTTSSLGHSSREHSLAAPVDRTLSKGGVSSTTASVTGSDGPGDGDLHASGDGALDRLTRRGSEDNQSETSSHRRKMSKLFKGRRKSRRKSMQDDVSPGETVGDIPPLPDMPDIRLHSEDARFQSEESLGLHNSVASSLLTEDSDAES